MPGFKLPAIDQNDEDWGPTTVPEAFRDVPFMPYSKGDRLGRIADFSQQASQRGYQGASVPGQGRKMWGALPVG